MADSSSQLGNDDAPDPPSDLTDEQYAQIHAAFTPMPPSSQYAASQPMTRRKSRLGKMVGKIRKGVRRLSTIRSNSDARDDESRRSGSRASSSYSSRKSSARAEEKLDGSSSNASSSNSSLSPSVADPEYSNCSISSVGVSDQAIRYTAKENRTGSKTPTQQHQHLVDYVPNPWTHGGMKRVTLQVPDDHEQSDDEESDGGDYREPRRSAEGKHRDEGKGREEFDDGDLSEAEVEQSLFTFGSDPEGESEDSVVFEDDSVDEHTPNGATLPSPSCSPFSSVNMSNRAGLSADASNLSSGVLLSNVSLWMGNSFTEPTASSTNMNKSGVQLQNNFNRLGIKCDPDMIITRLWGDLTGVLGYTSGSQLIGENVVCLMTDIIARDHITRLFPIAQTFKDEDERHAINSRLAHKLSQARVFTLVGYKEQSIQCGVQVHINKNRSCTVLLRRENHIDSPLVPSKFVRHINNIPKFVVEPMRNVVCIMMDLANSTNFAVMNRSVQVARLFHDTYKICNQIASLEFHPYGLIHETVGDSFFFIVNAPFMPKRVKFATFALYMATRLKAAINQAVEAQYGYAEPPIYFRCGIALGDMSGGVIDGHTFRLFGWPVNLASRLEGLSSDWKTCMSDEFVKQLEKESPSFVDTFVERGIADLKGFGQMHMGSVECTMDAFEALADLQGE